VSQPSRNQIDGVLMLIEQMISRDGGALSFGSYAAAEGRLVVDYDKGPNGGCSECVLDAESLKDFIVEAFETRGLNIEDVVLRS